MAPRPCSLRSTSSTGPSSAATCSATATGVHALPERDRGRGAGGQDGPRHPRQLRRPQASKVRAWLDRHGRFVFHFTRTSCSWFNAVDGFFARLSPETRPLPLRRRPPGRHQPLPPPKQTPNRSPSHGPQTPTKSSPPSDEGTKRYRLPPGDAPDPPTSMRGLLRG